MTVPAKRTICLLVSTVFLITSCASVMTVSYRGIPEKDIGEISFIAADEETGRLVTGIVVDVYRQGAKKPFRTFLTDERGPIQLTNLLPGKYTIRASKYVDHRGKNLLRIKAIDVLDFSAEAYLLVARPDVPE